MENLHLFGDWEICKLLSFLNIMGISSQKDSKKRDTSSFNNLSNNLLQPSLRNVNI